MIDDILIVGKGEVGSGFCKLLSWGYGDIPHFIDIHERYVKDKDYKYMIICLPMLQDFAAIVLQYAITFNPEYLVITTSTIPGTCRKISYFLDELEMGTKVYHIGIRGIHPDLHKGIKEFPKLVGTEDGKLDKNIVKIFSNVREYCTLEESEFAKLFSLLRYATDVTICKVIKEFCDGFHDLDFDKVYTKSNEFYNEGWKNLLPQQYFFEGKYYQRPILKPEPGPIGGHCVMPAIDKLYKVLDPFQDRKLGALLSYIYNVNEIWKRN